MNNKIRICFVCWGNICRSPMAEFIMKYLVKQKGLSNKFIIESKGTSSEELGNDIHPSTKRMLDINNIPYSKRCATKLLESDYDKFDYFIGMDDINIRSMKRLFGTSDKIYKLNDFINNKNDIDDPWYTNKFDITYNDIYIGCLALLEYLNIKKNLQM